MFSFEILAAIFLGLVFGSFATAVAYRVPRNIPWAIAFKTQPVEGQSPPGHSAYRSACPHCQTRLQVRDLLPIISWVLAGGKCRYCDARISRIYPVIEITALLATLAVYSVFGFSVSTIPVYLLVPFLVALLAVDLQHLILPNQLVLIVGVLGLSSPLFSLYESLPFLVVPDVGDNVAGFFVYPLLAWILGWIMSVLLKKEALGMGDVKFFAVAGLWLGLELLPWFCLLGGLLGVFLGLAWQKIHKNPVFPFGPALIAAFFILLLLDGSQIL